MGGTAYTKIDSTLSASGPYTAFRRGEKDVIAYQTWVEERGSANITTLNQDQINLSARFPYDKHEFVRRAMSQCRAHDIITDDHYDTETIEQDLSKVDAIWDHGDYMTYIFPEENALLYALVRNMRPRRAACIGSYYGYWAVAAKVACPDLDITLLDIDLIVMELARTNFKRLGLAHKSSFVVGNAEDLASEGPKSDDVPADYRDKAIYYPLLKAVFNNLVPGALLVAHNVILSNFTEGTYFRDKSRNYRKQYTKFLPFLHEHFSYTVVDSTEGTLVARKRSSDPSSAQIPSHPKPVNTVNCTYRHPSLTDLPKVAEIYNHAVSHTAATFDTEEKHPSYFHPFVPGDSLHRMLVAEVNGNVVAYAGIYPFSQRAAYAQLAEMMVYVHPAWQRRGIGRGLLVEIHHGDGFLTEIYTVLALINREYGYLPRVFEGLGYVRKGELTDVASKFGRRYSLVIYQRDVAG